MRFKLDENLPASVAPLFVARGHDVDTAAQEGLAGASDDRVVAAARDSHRALVTLDRGFADIRAYPPGSHPGIIVLRPRTERPGVVRAVISALVARPDLGNLQGCIVVVHPGVVRVRRPAP